jgi:phosphoribosylformylglycinamidine synthase
MANANVCVLKADGINCDAEMAFAFENAGAYPELVHVNQLREGERNLEDYGALAIPGGFSYGDDIASGKVLAVEMTSYLTEQLEAFAESEKPILGVCNGFQVLVRTGLLPDRNLGEQSVTLAPNETGRFECRWVDLSLGSSACKFIRPEDLETSEFADVIPMQIAHGEGRFFAGLDEIEELIVNGQIVFRYARGNNYNGSKADIAGICDKTGTILGMMPHPERSIAAFHPDRSRTAAARSAAKVLFGNIVKYVGAS